MREELAQLADGSRYRFRGVFRQYGSRPVFRDFREPTLLLGEICLADGTPICSHLWFGLTDRFLALGDLQRGDLLEFTARAAQYHKFIVRWRRGRREAEMDWHLTYPTGIVRVGRGVETAAPVMLRRRGHGRSAGQGPMEPGEGMGNELG